MSDYKFTTEDFKTFNHMLMEAVCNGISFNASYNPTTELYTITYTGGY